VAKLGSDSERRLTALRSLRRLLDEAFRVPGTRIRFGWDAIIGVIPWAGDLVTALMAGAIIIEAHRMRVPRVVQLRMLLNVGIDLAIGLVPFAGDVADVFWKSNTKNMAMLERHAAEPVAASAGDWAFVGIVIASVVAMALVPLVLISLMLQALFGRGLF
jgi:uncharacterized protein DUF4112